MARKNPDNVSAAFIGRLEYHGYKQVVYYGMHAWQRDLGKHVETIIIPRTMNKFDTWLELVVEWRAAELAEYSGVCYRVRTGSVLAALRTDPGNVLAGLLDNGGLDQWNKKDEIIARAALRAMK